MVNCSGIDGRPNPAVVYLIKAIIGNTLKLLLGIILQEERDEMRVITRIPNAKRYLEVYFE